MVLLGMLSHYLLQATEPHHITPISKILKPKKQKLPVRFARNYVWLQEANREQGA
jgi:hypothetical protein